MTDRKRVAYPPWARPFDRSGLMPHRSAPVYLLVECAGFAGSARLRGLLWRSSEAAPGEVS